MAMSLFSVFDPSALKPVQWKWVGVIFIYLFWNWQFFCLPVSLNMVLGKVLMVIHLSLVQSMKSVKEKSACLCSLFLMILMIGQLGMIPPIFTSTSHLSFNISISLPLWIGSVVYLFFSSWKKALSHFVPTASPGILIPFLVLIETISMMIRPFTLSIRLMANVMAGHLVLTLMSSSVSNLSFLGVFLGSVGQSLLIIFEMCVCVIQAYVFMSLMSLYWKESEE
nr:ATP synthase F0 subunit 6 [Chelopistes texanus]